MCPDKSVTCEQWYGGHLLTCVRSHARLVSGHMLDLCPVTCSTCVRTHVKPLFGHKFRTHLCACQKFSQCSRPGGLSGMEGVGGKKEWREDGGWRLKNLVKKFLTHDWR